MTTTRRTRDIERAREALDLARREAPGADAPWEDWMRGQRRIDAARRRVVRLTTDPIDAACLAGVDQHEEGWAA